MAPTHPLAALRADEITAASKLIRSLWPAEAKFQFKTVTLEEPPKALALAVLEAEHAGKSLPNVPRKVLVNYYLRNTNKFHEAIVNLSSGRVERNVRLGANVHGAGDGAEIIAVEKLALEHPDVKAEIAKLQLPEGAVVVCDPWIYGADGVNDDDRMWQCYLYTRDTANSSELDSCHYAHPLPISPVISTADMKLVRIDILPTGADNMIKPLGPIHIRPANEYIPEYQQLRTDLKPLNVVQPEGASFTVKNEGTSSIVAWQKWHMRVSFNQREGMVLHDIRYDNRPLFYRASLSDMNIPYADPRHPYHKKSAFDLGDVGAGLMANDLQLGCDCLGSIYYLSSVLTDDEGAPIEMPNVVCIHEQDAGIGWKHTNYRTMRAAVVRRRELVLQSIITVANYEYILAFIFDQTGAMEYEVRATGILSTQPIDDGVDVPFGTRVHPGVLAVHHQHIFSLRVDPHLDGSAKNRLVYEEAHAMPRSDFNPHGTGYEVHETVVSKAGGLDIDPFANRTFKIQNVASRNPINGKPVAYKIHIPAFQPMLADKQSFNYRRAEFADKAVYVVRNNSATDSRALVSDELYSGGKYTNQSRGDAGVRTWSKRGDSVVDEDIVVFVQFGLNHVPRIEDFPVMPVEIIKVGFKPVNFFDRNPALDVPPSVQAVNKSVGLNGEVEAKVGEDGKVESCCTKEPTAKL
ncbi:hypothetical protein EJ06DRAFT_555173 [Trichodelitschia bisporula]|uniref:Amine oxidase n=1 Tax=Trichodelitschia bisporula TaxID=703511 RepID=A0A6G1I3C6_9PEZI|nr:hypothetical protein EJ06DRAFT_555173 [Trichodelitschia bisporula]